jgi:tyrosyl-tRNA synthetase
MPDRDTIFPPKLLEGVEHLVSIGELEDRWSQAISSGKPLRIKVGFDPTAPDLHLGHYVLLRKLKKFQENGHRVFLIIGDFTARIGDPTGRKETRPPLSSEEIEKNARTYKEQVFRILDRDATEILYNSTWLESLRTEELIRITSLTTVARMLERDDFAKRFKAQNPIHLHEFLYPLLQGYDSVAVQADIEMGGTDQLFNLLMGREIQRAYGQKEQVILTLPLLPGLDGHQKMSKSLGNYVALNDPPEEQFGKIMSISDDLMWEYYRLLTDEPWRELKGKVEKGELHPMEAKENLAYLIVASLYHPETAERAKTHFHKIFRERGVPEEVPVRRFRLEQEPLWIPRVLKESGIVPSTKEALRLLKEGAVRLGGVAVSPPYELKERGDFLFKIGRRRFLRVIVE